MKSAIDKLQDDIANSEAEQQTRIQTLEAKNAQQNNRIEHLAMTRMHRGNTAQKFLAEKDKLQQILDSKADKIDGLKAEKDKLEERVEAQDARIEELRGEKEDVEKKAHKRDWEIRHLKYGQTQNAFKVQELEPKLDVKAARIDELEQELAAERAKNKGGEDARNCLKTMKRKFAEMAELMGESRDTEETETEAGDGK